MRNAQGIPWIGTSWQKQQSLLVTALPYSPSPLSSVQPNGWCLTIQHPAQLFLLWTVSHHPLSVLIHMTSPCPAHLVASHFLFLKAELEEGNKPKQTQMFPVSLCGTTGMLYNPNFYQA